MISFWFNADPAIPTFSLVRRVNDAIVTLEFILEWQNVNSVYFLKYRDDIAFYNLAITLSASSWHHIVRDVD
jgi:hypothetical protein